MRRGSRVRRTAIRRYLSYNQKAKATQKLLKTESAKLPIYRGK